jgi:hypothetical protein
MYNENAMRSITNFTDERILLIAIVYFKGLIREDGAAFEVIYMLDPNPIAVLIPLILMPQELPQREIITRNERQGRIIGLKKQSDESPSELHVSFTYLTELSGFIIRHRRTDVYVACISDEVPSRRTLSVQYRLIVHIERLEFDLQQLRII